MLFRVRNAAVACTALTLGVASWSGCEAKKQTEYVAGISTQVKVPRDLKTIRIDVSLGGANVFCRAYRVYDGRVQLPRSLGSLPESNDRLGEPITVTIVGFTEEVGDDSRIEEYDCYKAIKAGENARILRRSRQPYVRDKILFLPMALKYSCYDKDCETSGQDKTCKAGRCVDAAIDPQILPVFSEDLVDGTGGGCFRASECFAAAVPPVVVNADDCTYALPNTPSAPPPVEGAPPNPITTAGDGVNVQITYDGGFTSEILDKDELEGFTIPDPSKPQQFRLAPGLCDMVKGYDPEGKATGHRISAIRATGLCQAKSVFQPLCANDQLAAMGVDENGVAPEGPDNACKPLELKPPKAALLLLADDTENSKLFFQQVGEATLGISLADPAFSKTEMGLQYFPGTGDAGAASCGTFTPAVPMTASDQAKNTIRQALVDRNPDAPGNENTLAPLNAPVLLDGALRDAYTLLADPDYEDYFRKAVLVLGNRDFDATTCTGETPAKLAGKARAEHGIETYALLLARDNQLPAEQPLPGSFELAIEGGTSILYDARKDKAPAQDALQRVVNDLATCIYDVANASERPKAGDSLSYSDPITYSTVVVPFDESCNGQGTGESGWGLDPSNPKRLFVCGTSCDDYRAVLRKAALYAQLSQQPATAVPIFAHAQGCGPEATGPQPTNSPSTTFDAGAPSVDPGAPDAGTSPDAGGEDDGGLGDASTP